MQSNTEQTTLFPDTQLRAWRDLQPHLGERQAQVYDVIAGCQDYGATIFEIANRLKKPPNEVSGRCTELRFKGQIRDSGGRRYNPRTRKGGIVWVAVK